MLVPLAIVATLLALQEPSAPPAGVIVCWHALIGGTRCKNSSGQVWNPDLHAPVAPIRVRQALPTDLEFTIRGCLWRGPVDTPEWCGPPAQAQSEEVLRSFREHIRREIRK